MIAFVRGKVTAVGLDSAVVDVGGIGIEVLATPGTLADLRVGTAATLPTSLVVREESLTLYGFADDDERMVFQLLQTASGVGPRLAQAMLAVHRPDELRRAVAADDLVALTKVPGIGKKGAQRIVLELKDRLGPPASAVLSNGSAATSAPWREQVRPALLGLGWSAKEADGALDKVADLAEEQQAEQGVTDVPALLRAALQSLSRS
ncbi:Holliday junction branch migration protein RuvA [Flindersiella endophytica]